MNNLMRERNEWERQRLMRYLQEANTVAGAARAAGMNRTHFYNVLKRHGLAFSRVRSSRRVRVGGRTGKPRLVRGNSARYPTGDLNGSSI